MAAMGQFETPSTMLGGDGTCFNTGRQVTHPLRRFLIDEMTVSTGGKGDARTTPESRRQGWRPWIPRWAISGHRSPFRAHQKPFNFSG